MIFITICYTSPQFCTICIDLPWTRECKISIDPNQLPSQKAADLYRYHFHNRISGQHEDVYNAIIQSLDNSNILSSSFDFKLSKFYCEQFKAEQ